MNNEQIYKMYKHGAYNKEFQELSPKKIYTALKSNGLQVVLVKNWADSYSVYNFVPEIERFYKIK